MIRTRRQRKVPATVRQMRAMFQEMAKAADERQEAREQKWEAEKVAMAKAREARAEKWEEEKAAMAKDEERRRKEAEKTMEDLKGSIKEVSSNVGGISNNNGAFAEEVFGNSLEEKKEFAGIQYDEVVRDMKSSQNGVQDQFDVAMINHNAVAIIEIKYTAQTKHLTEMVEKKVSNFRTLFPYYAKHTIYLGIGSLSFNSHVTKLAKELGIGLLTQKGDTIEVDTSNIWAY
ncbi:hypothetical protein ACYULU_09390 [Breznakiellaceae bacterium SP9]